MLSKSSTDISDISKSLEREIILRRFNKDFLLMETPTGGRFNQISGIGMRADKSTGKLSKVTDFFPEYHTALINAFVDYPIVKYFGISIDDAMHLPIDRWNDILRTARELRHETNEHRDAKLLEILNIVLTREGGG